MDIIYVGLKNLKGDNIAGTGLTWARGQIHKVEDEKKAALLLKHDLVWRDATGKSEEETQAMLIQPPAEVPPEPRVSILSEGNRAAFADPFIIVVPDEVFLKLRVNELTAVFMTDDQADAFKRWQDAQMDTGPKRTGPRRKEGDPLGLPTKAGLDAVKKTA
jgi:hypothetical protein